MFPGECEAWLLTTSEQQIRKTRAERDPEDPINYINLLFSKGPYSKLKILICETRPYVVETFRP